jgi:hypothetical protein
VCICAYIKECLVTGFDADMVISHYYAGVSSGPPAWDNDTHDCTFYLTHNAHVFDVKPLQPLEVDTSQMTTLKNLQLVVRAHLFISVFMWVQ